MKMKLLSSYDRLSSPIGGICDTWARMLSLPSAESAALLASFIGLDRNGDLARLFSASSSFGIYVPKSKRQKRDLSSYKMIFQLNEDEFFLLHHPSNSHTNVATFLPPEFCSFFLSFGFFQFELFFGGFLVDNLALVNNQKEQIRLSIDLSGNRVDYDFVPFYSFGDGTFDCIRLPEMNEIAFFDRDEGKLIRFCSGSFKEWFNLRYLSLLKK